MRPVLILIAVLSTFGFSQKALAQTQYKIAQSQIKVAGSSNLHDWTMAATAFTCEGTFVVKNGQLQDLSALSFTLPISNLKSKEDLMDERAYKALNAEKYPKITFKLTDAVVSTQSKTIKATGNLTIAGATKLIAIQANYVVNSDESITIKAIEPVKMSDYKIKAPTFMLGALKVGDNVNIDINLKLTKSVAYTSN
jgi:polyisoprenoid-binding protein YceI